MTLPTPPGSMCHDPPPQKIDPDFAEEVLAGLYTYPRKRRSVAFLLWLAVGWFGGHRFYLDRPGTGLLMMFTGGGLGFWWLADAFFVGAMVASFNEDQTRRERAGDPPRALDFMPRLSREVLEEPPEWTKRWVDAGSARRRWRLAGDLVVLMVTAVGLGAVAGRLGVYEAVLAVLVLAGLATAGAGAARLSHLPVMGGVVRWNHTLRLFYYYNAPGHPLALLLRPMTGAISAPFRRRDRAEVRLYLQMGAVFTVLFLLADLGEAVLEEGFGALGLKSLLTLWVNEAVVTFVVIYAFATPIGAVLTRYLLVERTHTLPRVLAGVVVAAMALGMLL